MPIVVFAVKIRRYYDYILDIEVISVSYPLESRKGTIQIRNVLSVENNDREIYKALT